MRNDSTEHTNPLFIHFLLLVPCLLTSTPVSACCHLCVSPALRYKQSWSVCLCSLLDSSLPSSWILLSSFLCFFMDSFPISLPSLWFLSRFTFSLLFRIKIILPVVLGGAYTLLEWLLVNCDFSWFLCVAAFSSVWGLPSFPWTRPQSSAPSFTPFIPGVWVAPRANIMQHSA